MKKWFVLKRGVCLYFLENYTPLIQDNLKRSTRKKLNQLASTKTAYKIGRLYVIELSCPSAPVDKLPDGPPDGSLEELLKEFTNIITIHSFCDQTFFNARIAPSKIPEKPFQELPKTLKELQKALHKDLAQAS